MSMSMTNPDVATPASLQTELLQNEWAYGKVTLNGSSSLTLPSTNLVAKIDTPHILLDAQITLSGTLDAKSATVQLFDYPGAGQAVLIEAATVQSLINNGITRAGDGFLHLCVADDTAKSYTVAYTASMNSNPIHSLNIQVVMPSATLDTPTTATVAVTGTIIRPKRIKNKIENFLPLPPGQTSSF